MQRFQRQKYLNIVVRMRRELRGWEHTYSTIVEEGDLTHGPKKVNLAERRMFWVNYINELLEPVEEQLLDDADAEGE